MRRRWSETAGDGGMRLEVGGWRVAACLGREPLHKCNLVGRAARLPERH